MNIKTKVRILNYLAFIVIFLIIWTALHFMFLDLKNPYKGMIGVVITLILVPRINTYKNQSGNQMQLKWIFLKKVISI